MLFGALLSGALLCLLALTTVPSVGAEPPAAAVCVQENPIWFHHVRVCGVTGWCLGGSAGTWTNSDDPFTFHGGAGWGSYLCASHNGKPTCLRVATGGQAYVYVQSHYDAIPPTWIDTATGLC